MSYRRLRSRLANVRSRRDNARPLNGVPHCPLLHRLSLVLATALTVHVTGPVRADDFPSRPLRVIVPFSPGGAVDGPMRAHRAGARASASASRSSSRTSPAPARRSAPTSVAKAAPDGYTLLLASQTNAISATLYPKLPFDPIEDFAPISLIGREPGVLVVNPALPVKTLQRVHRVREGATRARSTTRRRATAAASTCSRRCSRRRPA